VHVWEIIFIVGINCLIMTALHLIQKRSIEQRVRHLKREVQDLEDLVAAIIEEFEDIANAPGSNLPAANHLTGGLNIIEDVKDIQQFPQPQPETYPEPYPESVSTPNNVTGDLKSFEDFNQYHKFFEEKSLENNLADELSVNDDLSIYKKLLRENSLTGVEPAKTNQPSNENSLALELNTIEDISLIRRPIGDKNFAKELNKSDSIMEKRLKDGNRRHEDFHGSSDQNLFGSHSSEDLTGNSPNITDPKHQRILDLRQQGVAVEEIARQLGTGRGEVQLILGIYKRS
jgi:hypothetical protein